MGERPGPVGALAPPVGLVTTHKEDPHQELLGVGLLLFRWWV